MRNFRPEGAMPAMIQISIAGQTRIKAAAAPRARYLVSGLLISVEN